MKSIFRITKAAIAEYGEQSCSEMEQLFHENLRLSPEDKLEQLEASEGFFVTDNGKLIGETMGAYVEDALRLDSEIPDLESYLGKQVFYVYTTSVLPAYQGKGFARMLRQHLNGYLRSQGCRLIVGHAREGAMSALVKEMGGTVVKEYPNYFECGYTAYLYALPL